MKIEKIDFEEAIKEKNDFKPVWFCPIVKGVCHTNCMFYNHPWVSNTSEIEIRDKEEVKVIEFFAEPGTCLLDDLAREAFMEIKARKDNENNE